MRNDRWAYFTAAAILPKLPERQQNGHRTVADRHERQKFALAHPFSPGM
jgi:hypothetical protein